MEVYCHHPDTASHGSAAPDGSGPHRRTARPCARSLEVTR
jgi:hypothetical protein